MNGTLSLSPVLQITVTKEDIQYGQRNNCWHCPIARAAGRATGCFSSIHPALLEIIDEVTGKDARYNVPPNAVAFMEWFDTQGPACVRPATFTFLPRS